MDVTDDQSSATNIGLGIMQTTPDEFTMADIHKALPFPLVDGSPRESAVQLVVSSLLRNAVFSRLMEIRNKGWNNPKGDEYFNRQRKEADRGDKKNEKWFFTMMKDISDQMQKKTGALRPEELDALTLQILDLCMAPGAFTLSVMRHNRHRNVLAHGITLPEKDGGHPLWVDTSKVQVEELDLTMLATEFGCETIPRSHPDHDLFLTKQPFCDQQFQLILCDGQVLRNTVHPRSEHRERFEARRLAAAQLILALQRIMPGGTIVMLLHKVEALETIQLLFEFDSFSEIQLFKPIKHHEIRSSFYLIAKKVQPHADTAQAALKEWREDWYRSTFGGEKDKNVDMERIQYVLDTFGGRLIELGEPIWKHQADALAEKAFTRGTEEAINSASTEATPPIVTGSAPNRYVPPHRR
ncbi:S-adenosyl-L-methionine-dependent methyltransferase-like [Venturia nashicola]|uniref:S-adenosyl-L-methionine-dependent methyltransferase-like n=1 Tax=Venturia nashicola TaxID=86259 RepID=A0A4Z1P9F1_9PEZI|nr:S-adenosyl-L-methionine-dependent methyltransferase-like [Venturia nashicola]